MGGDVAQLVSKVQVIFGYKARSGPAWDTQDPISKQNDSNINDKRFENKSTFCKIFLHFLLYK